MVTQARLKKLAKEYGTPLFVVDHDQLRKNLAEFIIAVRFAWLAQWLRNGDHEMIELELVYMKILVDNQAVLFR